MYNYLYFQRGQLSFDLPSKTAKNVPYCPDKQNGPKLQMSFTNLVLHPKPLYRIVLY